MNTELDDLPFACHLWRIQVWWGKSQTEPPPWLVKQPGCEAIEYGSNDLSIIHLTWIAEMMSSNITTINNIRKKCCRRAGRVLKAIDIGTSFYKRGEDWENNEPMRSDSCSLVEAAFSTLLPSHTHICLLFHTAALSQFPQKNTRYCTHEPFCVSVTWWNIFFFLSCAA